MTSDPTLEAAFSPDRFRAMGHRVIDRLADYLARAQAGDGPVLPWVEPGTMVGRWPADFAQAAGEDALTHLLAEVLDGSIHLHHPHYIGHQVSAPLPVSALIEAVAALLNNGTAVYEMGAVSTAMERQVIRWLGGLWGFGGDCDGVLTSGGSAGNLTALLAMRQARAGFDAWSGGTHSGPPLAVLAGDQAHYSVQRAATMMGWGTDGVVKVPSDAHFRLDPAGLQHALNQAVAAGRKVIGVVASAASTATGAFDPLEPIADFCDAHGLWLHVDGAHGAAVALSETHRALVKGIDRADSVVCDPHKMMLSPALVSAVVFRDGRHSYGSFAQEASYLFHGDPEAEWFNLGQRTLECTKRMLSLKVYLPLRLYGQKFFADYIDGRIALAKEFAAMLREAPDFTVAVEPDCNIVCFRHEPSGVTDLDALQVTVRDRIIKSGRFYIVRTTLPTGVHLRTTLLNPQTTTDHLIELLDEIRRVGREVVGA